MMSLSSMKKVIETVDSEWRSPLAEKVLERWGYDKGSVYSFRSSANHVFVFRAEGKRYFLRFIDNNERELQAINSEIEILLYLHKQNISVALPVKSSNEKYVEIVETSLGTYYAVVLEGLEGNQYQIKDLNNDQFFNWGKSLGKLHKVFKDIPKQYHEKRPGWNDHLTFVKETLPNKEKAAIKELEEINKWIKNLNVTNENFGIIHYDFELDNLYFNNDEVRILDFDDCSNYWYVADIAFALRDLFNECIDYSNPSFQQFLNGYREETDIDESLLCDLSWFMRLHNLITFARLLRTIDIQESEKNPEWLIDLRNKLKIHTEYYRTLFEKNYS